MIGKIARFGSRFLGALQYVYFGTKANRTRDLTTLRGELVFGQGLNLTTINDARLKGGPINRLHIEAMAETMQRTAALNNRLQKPVWHQSFAFPPGEQPSNATLAFLCEAFVETFGLTNNQVMAFRHQDKNHDHIHIIANRVDGTGRTTAHDSQNYRRTAEFCRRMEAQLGLTPTRHLISEELDGKRRRSARRGTERTGDGVDENPSETEQLRTAIDNARTVGTDVSTFVEQLRQRGYMAIISERTGPDGNRRAGIVYGKMFPGGTERWISGSALGPAYTYKSLTDYFNQKQTVVTAQKIQIAKQTPTPELPTQAMNNQPGKDNAVEVRQRFNP